ncbi:MAG: nucleotide sugar dehydrogenase [Nitrosopumilaceae archaeon]
MNTKSSMLANVENTKQSLESKSIHVCVVGIGRIGLPTALSFANYGLETTGVDVNDKLIEMVNTGIYPLNDEPGFDIIFDNVIKNKKLKATNNMQAALSKAELVILSLPTPMDSDNVPDYSALRSVAESLNDFMKAGTIIVVESTVEPGFIENKLIPTIEGDGSRIKCGKDFAIAACPEAANPGEILDDFTKLPRVIGGIDEITTEIVSEIYKHIFNVEIIKMPNCRTANAVKLTTNVFRDVNIAFVNELALLFEKLGIDIFTVLDAAKRKYNFQVHYPGSGVGGPCLPVNSYQLLNTSRIIGNNLLKTVKASREVNENMPAHVVRLLHDCFEQINEKIEKCTILVLGITYKPDVKDIQLSPAESIINNLTKLGCTIKIYDPYYKNQKMFGIDTEADLIKVLPKTDAIIINTAHKEFYNIDPTLLSAKMKKPIVVDARGVIDIHAAKKSGLVFRGLGRGIS